jgi:polar amino acid transport system substrate-binding protein
MKQATQKLKNGSIRIIEAPVPIMRPGMVLVKNFFSLVSAGTEKSTVKAARKGYIGKAKERPQQLQQVVETFKSKGPVQTYRAVMKKLDAYSPLGYSCVGKVIDIYKDINEFKIGDIVACGGLTACHAEVVCVPKNLCVKLKPDADLKQAVYNTLGAIALQGIRQADLRLGETCAVIGLGLIGQLTSVLLRASGIRVVGIDTDQNMVNIAKKNCLDIALNRNNFGIEERINSEFTSGLGCDAVIITAASNSLDPINFAGAISRKRGTIVVVGAIPTGFDREPHFYQKELQVKMSCSYGPGRYDPNYEEKGIDYPAAYVRWTEKRNMEIFQELIYRKQIDINYLTTHIFRMENTKVLYDMLLKKEELFIGILIEYDTEKKINRRKIFAKKTQSRTQRKNDISIGFIGAGSYAQGLLLPILSKNKDVTLKGVMTASGSGSRSIMDRYGFEFCTSNAEDIFENQEINAVFIATRHDSHAQYVIEALKAGKHVFVEKPLCLTENELNDIESLYNNYNLKKVSSGYINHSKSDSTNCPILMVGYNRRYASLTEIIKNKFSAGRMAMIYRINAGKITSDSWMQDPDIGGGRIIGEVCHFVDYLTYLNGSLPISAYANALNDNKKINDIVNISLSFENGSIGCICYLSNGDKSLPKERVEIYSNGMVAVLDDFKNLTIHCNGKNKFKKLLVQDKGQNNQIKNFIKAIKYGGEEIIPFSEIYNSTLVTLRINDSIRKNQKVEV